MEFHAGFFVVKDKLSKKVLLERKLKDILYQFKFTNQDEKPYYQDSIASNKLNPSIFTAKSRTFEAITQNESKFKLWNLRLGHPLGPVMSQVLNSSNEKLNVNKISHFCDACQLGKSHSLPFNFLTLVLQLLLI